MKKNLAIELKKITKSYVLRHEKPTFVEQLFGRAKTEKYFALKSVSLQVAKGEKVGIIGKNGSGKTTILKIIAGITTANQGSVQTTGQIVSLINLNAGFHPELTGEENIFLNGMLLGMTKQEIVEQKAAIIAFAEIGQFIDAPFYTYSEGMKLRLGFSVAIHADPDILILDEGLAVGDKNFQVKARKKIQELFALQKTILVVSHWGDFLRKNCNRIIWIKDGRIYKDGGLELIAEYER